MNLRNFWERSLRSRNWPKRLEQLAEELSNLAQNLANQGPFVRQPVPVPVRNSSGGSGRLHPRNQDSFLCFFSRHHQGHYAKGHNAPFTRFFLSSHHPEVTNWFSQYMNFLRGSHSRFATVFFGHAIGVASILQLPLFARFFLSSAANEMFATRAVARVVAANGGNAYGLGSGAGVFLASGCLFTHIFVNLRRSRAKCLNNMFSTARNYHSYHRYNFNQHHYHYYNNYQWKCRLKHGLKFFKYKGFFSRRFHSSNFWWKYRPAFLSIRDQIFNSSKFSTGGYMFLNFFQGKTPLGLGGGYKGANTQIRTFTQLRSLLFGIECDHSEPKEVEAKGRLSKPSAIVKAESKAKTNHTLSLKFPKSIMSISLSPNYHYITLQMARADSTATVEEKIEADQLINGSYIEFSIFASLGSSFNHETVLSEETIDELLEDLDVLIQRIQTLKQDLEKIFELGALPIKFIKSRWVLRVYFPNCEPEKLQKLCQEKNVMGGTIFEDLEHLGDAVVGQTRRDSVCSTPVAAPDTVEREQIGRTEAAAISEPPFALTAGHIGMFNQLDHASFPSDVLSTFDNSSTISTDLTNDIISLDPLSNEDIIRIEDGALGTTPLGHVMPLESVPVSIVDSYSDEYYWVSSS